jgi:uncharacterized protein
MVLGLFECVVRHNRVKPIRYGFDHRTYYWLTDVDESPQLPRPLRWFADFQARDHFGDPGKSIRANLEEFLRANGIDLGGGRVWMLAQPRVLGYVFNPLSVFWCHDSAGQLTCVVAEVHNTYGGRHCYLLFPKAGTGIARTAKEFYVSPFFEVDGEYEMRLPEPDQRLDLLISLERAGSRPFTARLTGRKISASRRNIARLALRYPLHTTMISLRIRWHGLRLFRKGLPVVPRGLSDTAVEESSR